MWSLGVKHGAGRSDFEDGGFFVGVYDHGIFKRGKLRTGNGDEYEGTFDEHGKLLPMGQRRACMLFGHAVPVAALWCKFDSRDSRALKGELWDSVLVDRPLLWRKVQNEVCQRRHLQRGMAQGVPVGIRALGIQWWGVLPWRFPQDDRQKSVRSATPRHALPTNSTAHKKLACTLSAQFFC